MLLVQDQKLMLVDICSALSSFYSVVTLTMTTKSRHVLDIHGDSVKSRMSGHGYNSAHRYHAYHPKSRPKSRGSVVDSRSKQSAANLSNSHSPRSRTYVVVSLSLFRTHSLSESTFNFSFVSNSFDSSRSDVQYKVSVLRLLHL